MLENRRILIKNIENGEVIADTKIIRYDSQMNFITISAGSLAEKRYYNVQAYIFARECLYEFNGVIRGVVVNNEIEVLLGKISLKENRAKIRYPIALEGEISSVDVHGRSIPLRKPIHMQTINMSSDGILVRADAGSFEIGEKFSLLLGTQAGAMRVACEIVRMQNCGMLTEEYGCWVTEIRLDRENKRESKK